MGKWSGLNTYARCCILAQTEDKIDDTESVLKCFSSTEQDKMREDEEADQKNEERWSDYREGVRGKK